MDESGGGGGGSSRLGNDKNVRTFLPKKKNPILLCKIQDFLCVRGMRVLAVVEVGSS